MPLGSKLRRLLRRLSRSSLTSSLSTSPDEQPVFNVVVMGPRGVGKTTLTEQFMYDGSGSDPERAGLYAHQELFQLEDQCLKLEVLDVSTVELSVSMKQRVMLQGDAFILVYSLLDKHSFKAVKVIRDEILAINKERHISIVIVGNKLDQKKRQRHVQRALIKAVVKRKWGHAYLEVSAKNYVDVCNVFIAATKESAANFPLSAALYNRKLPHRRNANENLEENQRSMTF